MAKRILSIDDEKMIRMVLQIHFKNSGYELVTTESGAKGIELAASEKFDLILCDIKLGAENGIDIIKTLKAAHAHIPVIAITGLIGDEIMSLVTSAGADAYISKPFTKQELLSLVSTHIPEHE